MFLADCEAFWSVVRPFHSSFFDAPFFYFLDERFAVPLSVVELSLCSTDIWYLLTQLV